MKKYFALIYLAILFISVHCNAQINQSKEIQTSQSFGEYTVHYNVFNSKTIPADIADTYHLKRGRDLAIVNVALTKAVKNTGGATLGLAANISGKATNLMQQSTALKFSEIQEGDAKLESSATYYLATFRYLNEEDIHFSLQVSPKDEPEKTFELNFTRKLYTEN